MLPFLPRRILANILIKAYDILYPPPAMVTLYGTGLVHKTCSLMMDYGDIANNISDDEQSTLKLRISKSNHTDDIILEDPLAILLYISKISNCLPVDHFEMCRTIQVFNNTKIDCIPDFICEFRQHTTWAFGYAQPTLIDFYMIANITEADVKLHRDIRYYMYDLYFHLDSPYPVWYDESESTVEHNCDTDDEMDFIPKKYN